ncbi:alpha/beta hydrolase family protein [Streptomyces sp. SudanB182_2057]|uniref:alpha/beta hydrolase family protein n=1 Tax=Streptomyces sp. SudanB182_2057 TaxID=3035281 RepID=UPI003F5520CC
MPPVRPSRRSLIAGGLAAAAAVSLPAPAYASASGPVPLRLAGPTGPFAVGAVELHLVDRSRTDPWSGLPRELMATVAYPAVDVRDRPRLPWLPPGAERALKARYGGALDGYAMPLTHGAEGAPARPGRYPVLLYSPGAASDRTFNTLVVEELVSWGYAVVTVDHPYDSGEVEFPDGRVVLSVGEDSEEEVVAAVAVRAADLRFVLDHLTVPARGGVPGPGRRRLPRGLRAALDPTRVGAFGHSRGGAAAAALMDLDHRVRAGADLDGTVFGPVVGRGLDRPFLLMDTAEHDGLVKDPHWPEFWRNLRGWRRCLRLADAGHLSFSDIVALAPQLPPGLPLPVGTVPADRAVAAVRATVRAFFDLQLRGRPDTGLLLRGASARHPEIGYVAG